MTESQLLLTIRSLPPSQQFELANRILDELAESGTWPLSDETKRILDRRADNADANPESRIPAETVFASIREKLKAS